MSCDQCCLVLDFKKKVQFLFYFLKEPRIWCYECFFEFLKPMVPILFTKNLELIQFKTSFGFFYYT